MPGAKEACARLLENDHNLIFVSNQSGIGKGVAKHGATIDVFEIMLGQIYEEHDPKREKMDRFRNKQLDYIFCPHTSDFGCECRKPKPGMLWKKMVDLELRADQCWMIGDRPSDMKAGWNAGIRKLIKLPSLEEPESSLYFYEEAARNFNRRTSSGVLIDNLPHAVDFLLEWERRNA
jgi:D-glycero-D-manno-heptose 1,7-bisphosphate phosphatase